MDGKQRRAKIIEMLCNQIQPIKGSEFAGKLKVSRQVIVQDIALLKACNHNILSTNKGYVLYQSLDAGIKRTMHVTHKNNQIQDELYIIVDHGAMILDVVVEHEIYGQITVDLLIKNRQDVDEFIDKLKTVKATPLKELTNGVHFHTIQADSDESLDKIENKLRAAGYLM